jgi:enoyl-CoA hydratase
VPAGSNPLADRNSRKIKISERVPKDPAIRTRFETGSRRPYPANGDRRKIGVAYQNIIVEIRQRVGLIRLNRPEVLNALSNALVDELDTALESFDKDPDIGCIVLAGSEKVFAAGADIKEMQGKTYPAVYLDNFLASWDRAANARKPLVAAVSGFALGGGCELAMICDFVIASDTARFGQPEIKLGVMPGAGGTQRLTRFIGKSKAMDMCLTGRMIDAQEAERCGLVSRVVPAARFLDEALQAAAAIAAMSLPAAMAIKESVNRAFEMSLAEGLRFERRQFQAMFATEDQKEGMAAFLEKRAAKFRHR